MLVSSSWTPRLRWYVNLSEREKKILTTRVPWQTRYYKNAPLMIILLLMSFAFTTESFPDPITAISWFMFSCLAAWILLMISQDLRYITTYRRLKREDRVIDFDVWGVGYTLVHNVLFAKADGRGLEGGYWREVLDKVDPTLIDLFFLDPENRRLLRSVEWGEPTDELRQILAARAQAILDDSAPYVDAVQAKQRQDHRRRLEVERLELIRRIDKDTTRLLEISGTIAAG